MVSSKRSQAAVLRRDYQIARRQLSAVGRDSRIKWQQQTSCCHSSLAAQRPLSATGIRAIRKVNPKLQVLGLLPSMVDVTAFQRDNFAQLIEQHSRLLVPCGTASSDYAFIPRRCAIARAQMSGGVLWRLPAPEARQAWHDIEASVVRIAAMVTAGARP